MRFKDIRWFEKLDSTNSYLANIARSNPDIASGTVIAARNQTNGRGRKDHTWISHTGNLTFSVLIKTPCKPQTLPTLTMVAGLAVASALDNYGLHASLKWPNDILIDGKKICGILCEFIDFTAENEMIAVLGIGLNVNMTHEHTQAIDKPCTSMSILLDTQFDIADVLNSILKELADMIGVWQEKGFTHFKQQWIDRCPHIGQPIEICEDQQTVIKGIFVGISDSGVMMIETPDGRTHEVISGDVSCG